MAIIKQKLVLGLTPIELIIRSPGHERPEHWLASRGRHVACIGSHCMLCESLPSKRPLWLCVETVFELGAYYVLKVPHSDESMLSWIRAKGRSIIGLQVAMSYTGKAESGAVSLQIHGHRLVKEIPIAKYCAVIGVKDYWSAVAPPTLSNLRLEA